MGKENKRIPECKEIKESMKLVNYKDVLMNPENTSVKLRNINQSIDLGGVAKGFAADEICLILKENKVSSALIDLGGNIFALGNKVNGKKWKIGVQNPFDKTKEYIGILHIINKSVVTSGSYERYFELNNKKYHHIIDTKTGYPIDNKIVSVTVISDRSIDGDSLASCAYTMGLESGYELIESIKDVEAIFITEDKSVFLTSGVKRKFKLIDKNFAIKEEI